MVNELKKKWVELEALKRILTEILAAASGSRAMDLLIQDAVCFQGD